MDAWTPEQLLLLRTWAGKVTPAELAKKVGRSASAVRTRASREGLFIGQRRAPRFSPDEDRQIQIRWTSETPDQIAARLGRTPASIRARAELLELPSRTTFRPKAGG